MAGSELKNTDEDCATTPIAAFDSELSGKW